jgi:TatD DNase family protein
LTSNNCHIDLFEDVLSLVQAIESQQIYTIAVTNTPSVYHYTYSLGQRFSHILPAIGIHPELAYERERELPQLWEWLERTRFVGEVGLDYVTGDEKNRLAQRRVFGQILERSAEYGDKIITIHSRKSAKDVITAIGANFPGKIILHWFSGTRSELEQALENDYYFSVNSAMVSSKKGRDLVTRIPRHRLLTETDGPFVKISGTPSSPLSLPLITASISEIWNLPVARVQETIVNNFRELERS